MLQKAHDVVKLWPYNPQELYGVNTDTHIHKHTDTHTETQRERERDTHT